MLGIRQAYNIVKTVIACPEYNSLKQLMLQIYFKKFYFIPLTNQHTLNNEWNEFPLYLFRDKGFEELAFHNSVTKPIDISIKENLGLKSWGEIFPKTRKVEILSGKFIKMRLLVEHIYDLQFFNDTELDDIGNNIIKKHTEKVGPEIQNLFQFVLDSLTEITMLFPFEELKYNTDELEQEYWNTLMEIKKNIFPTDKGDEEEYQLKIDIYHISDWVERLKICSNNWGIFTLLVFGKYIEYFQLDNKS